MLFRGELKIGNEESDEGKFAGAICGDGMCPYVPCVRYPFCGHGFEDEN